jgi:Uma2 family endonuclease
MLVQGQHRFTATDYYRMAETGVLKPDARVELLDGRIVDMSPIGPPHGGSVNRLNRLFSRLSAGRWLVSVQNPVHLDEYSEPQPDLMLLKPAADDYTRRHPRAEDVLLLVEVADTSLDLDRGEKLSLYGRGGIPEVWILNVREGALEVYREPHVSGYGSKATLRVGASVSPLAFPEAVVHVTEILGGSGRSG